MKKLLILLGFAILATSSQAASITWSAASVKFGTTSLKSNSAVTGYLVYLGYNGTLADSYLLADLPNIASGKVAEKTGTSAMSQLSGGDYDVPVSTYKNGDTFAMLLSYNDGEKTWWNLSSTVYTISGLADATSTLEAAKFGPGFNYTTTSDASMSVSKGGGWAAAPIPEPGTAAMALLGLGLLIRRRKA